MKTKTQEEIENETMECISGMIRYGYQEAIDQLKEWLKTTNNDCEEGYIALKLKEMESNKHEINLQKLKKEINSSFEKLKQNV